MRTVKEIETEMWELGLKIKKLESELYKVLDFNRKKLMEYLNDDGSWDIEKMKKDGII